MSGNTVGNRGGVSGAGGNSFGRFGKRRFGHGYFVFVGPLSDKPDKVCYARWSHNNHVVFDTLPLSQVQPHLEPYLKQRGSVCWPLLVKAQVRKVWRYDQSGRRTHYDVELDIVPPDMTCKVVNTMVRHNMLAHVVRPHTLEQIKNLEFM